MKNHKKHLDTLEAIADAAVAVELDEGRPTVESRAAATRYHALVTDKLAAMRRAELARITTPEIERRPIRASLLAMARDALDVEYARLKQTHPQVGFAFKKLSEVTDDDMRSMIEDIYWTVEGVS